MTRNKLAFLNNFFDEALHSLDNVVFWQVFLNKPRDTEPTQGKSKLMSAFNGRYAVLGTTCLIVIN